MLKERELVLNKLCKREPLPLLADPLPLLSPTTPTYTRSYKKSYKPSPALDSDDDDDVPLVYLQSPTSKPSSLLSDQEEDKDKYLVLIAVLDIKPTEEFQTAADKYKLKAKERLQFDGYLRRARQ